MPDNAYKFRRIKHGAPAKLKVLAEDLSPRRHSIVFIAIVCAVAALVFAASYLA